METVGDGQTDGHAIFRRVANTSSLRVAGYKIV